MWTRINRLKNLDTSGLHHTEWSKKLGSVAISAFLTSVGFPMGIFLLVPYCAREIAGPSTSLSMLMAFVVTIITGLHLVEMCGRVPKSGCTYTYVYVTFGEMWAFLCAWTTVIDYCATSAYLAKGWSAHFDFLFHGSLREHLNPYLMISAGNLNLTDENSGNSNFGVLERSSMIIAERFDILAAMGLLTASFVALLGVSVTATVCVALLVVGILVVSSSILVGFFYANIAVWSRHGFFAGSLEGVCTAAAYLLRAMTGFEMIGSMIEETTNPQNRFSVLFPLMNSLLFVYLFIISVVITLVVPYFEIPAEAALPSVYGLISVPASRYVLSVGSICSLSGALLASLLPATRYIHTLSVDGLLCGVCSKFSTICASSRRGNNHGGSGIPLPALLASIALTFGLLFIDTKALLSIVRILLPARFILLTAATLMQRYHDTPTGLLAEVANYKAVQFKSKSMSSFFSGTSLGGAGSIADGINVYNGGGNGSSSINSRNASDRYSISSSFIMRNIAAAQYEDMVPIDDDRASDREEAPPEEDEEESDRDETPFEHIVEQRSTDSRRRRRSKAPAKDSTVDDDEVTIFNRSTVPVAPPPPRRSATGGELSSLLRQPTDEDRGTTTTTTTDWIGFEDETPTAGRSTERSIQASSSKVKKSATSVSFQSINLSESARPGHHRSTASHPHNCIRSPCSPTHHEHHQNDDDRSADPFYHLYQRDTPEGIPYCETFSMYSPSTTAVNQCLIYRRAKLWLAFCLCSHLASAICVVRGWDALERGDWWMYVMATTSFTAAAVGTVALGWLPQNVDNRVRHHVPGEPYLALFNTFLLSLMLASADFGGVWKIGVILVVGLLIYFIHGYRHSLEHLRSLSIAPRIMTTAETNENTGLVAPMASYQMSASASKTSFATSNARNEMMSMTKENGLS